jgi:Arrestin (or S-antigen), N-terminal domain
MNRIKGISRFEIHIENDRTTFLPGQKVEGFIALKLDEEMALSTLKIRFTGKVITYLQRTNSGIANENSTVTMFKDFTNFLEGVVPTLSAGEHIYPFQFRMPPTTLPASFVGPYGMIKYELMGICQRPGAERLVITSNLSVPSSRDSNDEDLQLGNIVQMSGSCGRWFWNVGNFHIIAKTPKLGYTSGI